MSKKIEVTEITSEYPIPVRVSHPMDRLEVGESYSFPLAKRASVQTTASRIKKEHGKEFTIKKIDDEVARVWRTK